MNAGIHNIFIVFTPRDMPRFKDLLGEDYQFGVNLTYAVQPSPYGPSEAFIIDADFIGDNNVAMELVDNIFVGHGLKKCLEAVVKNTAESGKDTTVFGYYVDELKHFSIVEFDANGTTIGIEEKHVQLKSNYCMTGLYCYDNRMVEYTKPEAFCT